MNGFPIHFEGLRKAFFSPNLFSTPEAVDSKLLKKLVAHQLLKPPFSPFRISPLGVVPEKVPREYD